MIVNSFSEMVTITRATIGLRTNQMGDGLSPVIILEYRRPLNEYDPSYGVGTHVTGEMKIWIVSDDYNKSLGHILFVLFDSSSINVGGCIETGTITTIDQLVGKKMVTSFSRQNTGWEAINIGHATLRTATVEGSVEKYFRNEYEIQPDGN